MAEEAVNEGLDPEGGQAGGEGAGGTTDWKAMDRKWESSCQQGRSEGEALWLADESQGFA